MNQLVTIMKIIKLKKRLTKRTLLNVSVSHTRLISKELMDYIAHNSKGYLMLGHRMNCDYRHVRVSSSRPSEDDGRHCPSVGDHHPLEAPWDERSRINKLIGHGIDVVRWGKKHCSFVSGVFLWARLATRRRLRGSNDWRGWRRWWWRWRCDCKGIRDAKVKR